jgi:hypothetical protein
MKKLAILMFVLAASLAAQDLSGIWNGKGGKEDLKYGKVPATAQMTILQAGTTFHGTIKLNSGKPMTIATGTSSGGKLTFSLTTTGGGRITGNLALSGGQLTGKMTSSTGSIYDFVFTKRP